jgi:uncharacterized phage protein gp47/JayE
MISRPSINDISNSIITEIETNLGINVSDVKGNLIKILSAAFAGELYDSYNNVLYLSRQFFPFWSEGEYLDNWGSLYNIIRQLPTAAYGTITVTGTAGSDIPDKTVFVRADGIEYETASIATIPVAESIDIVVNCLTVGTIGNYNVGNILSLLSPIAGVDTDAILNTSIANGFELESDQSFRDRIIAKIQIESKNGKAGDWVDWTKEVSGVKNVWEYRLITGAGSIGVGFSVDGTNQIPDAAKILEVKNYLETKSPIDFKEIVVLAIVEQSINLTLSISPDSAGNRTIISDLIASYFATLNPSTKDVTSKIYLSQLNIVVNSSAGIVTNITSPVTDVTLLFNNIPKLGTITWA